MIKEPFHPKRRKEQDLNTMDEERITDRFSQLPEDVILHIFSFLPRKFADRLGILSRTLKDIRATLPPLVVYEFDNRASNARTGDEFVEFSEESLAKVLLHEQLENLQQRIHKFRLCIEFKDDLTYCIDQWLGFVFERNVEELELGLAGVHPLRGVGGCSSIPVYSLPQSILIAAESLTVMKLHACGLDRPFSRATFPKFSSLLELSLNVVYLNEHMIKNLIRSCPLIELFILKDCSGLKHLRVSGLDKLKRLEVIYNKLKRLYIDAPSLRFFCYIGNPQSHRRCGIEVVECELKMLVLNDQFIDDQLLQDLLFRFPSLETFHLCQCEMLERVNISSHRLQWLGLHDDEVMENINIDTPNLRVFKYWTQRLHFVSLMNASDDRLEVELIVTLDQSMGTLWFVRLRDFLATFKKIETLILNLEFFNLQNLGDLPIIPPLSNVKTLKLAGVEIWFNYGALLDGLFWSFHPETLYFRTRDCDHDIITKLVSETIIDRDEDPECCGGISIKCWRHHLKQATVEIIERPYENYQNRNVLPTLPPARESAHNEVYFRLIW